MKCSRCGKCCESTRMELSEDDIVQLERVGYAREDFMAYDDFAFARLRNVRGACFFFDPERRECRVYQVRPTGCRIYPVNCDQDGDLFVDDDCQAASSVSKGELRRKAGELHRQMRKIDDEAERRRGAVRRP